MPAKKYHFTTEIDELIRQAYRQYYTHENGQALIELADRLQAKLGWPRHVSKGRAIELRVTQAKPARWTPEEDAFLEKCGHLNLAAIKMRFRRTLKIERSLSGILCRLTRLRIRTNLDGYTCNQLAHAFGEDFHKVERWIRLRMLQAERRGHDRPVTGQRECDHWWISQSNVREFVAAYPGEIRLACVEKWWFLDLVSGGAISERSAELGELRIKVSALIEAAKITEQRRKAADDKILALERDLARAMESAREASAKHGAGKPRRVAIRNAVAELADAIAQVQGRRVTREGGRHLQDLLARLEMILQLPADAAAETPNSVAAFLSSVMSA